MAECVKHVKGIDSLYDSMRSNFKQLGKMAQEYATMHAGGGFRSASGVLDRVSKKARILAASYHPRRAHAAAAGVVSALALLPASRVA